MTTFDINSFPTKLSEIDKLSLSDHHHLVESDKCYYLGEYTARAGYAHSPTNNLVINFKKPMSRAGQPQWKYKVRAIRKAAEVLASALEGVDFEDVSFVPIPPSKSRDDPEYDDRVAQTLRLAFGTKSEILDPISVNQSREAFHNNTSRCPLQLASSLNIDQTELQKCNSTVVLFDDVITTGCHYRAVKDSLDTLVPDKRVVGLFLARRVPQTDDFDSFY